MQVSVIAFIASLTAFSITGTVAIVCFKEMKVDMKLRSKAYLQLAMARSLNHLKHQNPINDNHKPIQSFKT
jgi:hypothetical protein